MPSGPKDLQPGATNFKIQFGSDIYFQEESLSFPPVIFEDIKQYSGSPMHIRMRAFRATWHALIDEVAGAGVSILHYLGRKLIF